MWRWCKGRAQEVDNEDYDAIMLNTRLKKRVERLLRLWKYLFRLFYNSIWILQISCGYDKIRALHKCEWLARQVIKKLLHNRKIIFSSRQNLWHSPNALKEKFFGSLVIRFGFPPPRHQANKIIADAHIQLLYLNVMNSIINLFLVDLSLYIRLFYIEFTGSHLHISVNLGIFGAGRVSGGRNAGGKLAKF